MADGSADSLRRDQELCLVAEQIGRPKVLRAVGQALGQNPLPVIIPCHRVVAANGGLGGFSGGVAMKRLLLDLEGSG